MSINFTSIPHAACNDEHHESEKCTDDRAAHVRGFPVALLDGELRRVENLLVKHSNILDKDNKV